MATLIVLALVITLCWKAREVADALDMRRWSDFYPQAPSHGPTPSGLNEAAGTLPSPLTDILARSPQRDAETFLKGAGATYELVVTAFATGELEPVRYLLGDELAVDFSGAIAERRQRGEKLTVTFIGLAGLDIIDGAMEGEMAWIDVRIVGQMVSVLRNSMGTVLLGDPLRVVDMPELWTFERNMNAADPVWRLVTTEPEE